MLTVVTDEVRHGGAAEDAAHGALLCRRSRRLGWLGKPGQGQDSGRSVRCHPYLFCFESWIFNACSHLTELRHCLWYHAVRVVDSLVHMVYVQLVHTAGGHLQLYFRASTIVLLGIDCVRIVCIVYLVLCASWVQ